MRSTIPDFLARVALIGSVFSAAVASAITPAELASRMAQNEAMLIIDVRSAIAYEEGHIPGAMNIPLALLAVKPLPANLPVVVYGDGLGVVDDARALAVARAKQGIRAEMLEGGYAAWMAGTRLTTLKAGVERERLPGITYSQLLAANKTDMVLVDLRGSATPPPTAAQAAPRRERQVAAAPAPDLLAEFSAKVGIPVVSGSRGVSASTVVTSGSAAGSPTAGPARAAAPATAEVPNARLLVLVADNESVASEVARELRASGNYRFTILIGGTESIRYEGRVGSARMDSEVSPAKTPSAR